MLAQGGEVTFGVCDGIITDGEGEPGERQFKIGIFAAHVAGHQLGGPDANGGVKYLVFPSRWNRRWVGAFTEPHQHQDLRVECGSVVLDGFFGAAAEGQCGDDAHGGFGFQDL